MRISNNTNYRPKFGMALYMPAKAKLAKELSNYAAKELENARPKLEQMAKNIDIEIYPNRSDNMNLDENFIEIIVSKTTEETPKSFLKKVWEFLTLKDAPFVKNKIFGEYITTDNVIENTKDAIQRFEKMMG